MNTQSRYRSFVPIYWLTWCVSLVVVVASLIMARLIDPLLATNKLLGIVALYVALLAPLLIMVANYETDRMLRYLQRRYRYTISREMVLRFVFAKRGMSDPAIEWFRGNYKQFLVLVWTVCLSLPVLLIFAAVL